MRDNDQRFHLLFKYTNNRGTISSGEQVLVADSIENAARRIMLEREINSVTICKRYWVGRPANQATEINKNFSLDEAKGK